jgi:hypothetical protein
MDTVVKIRGPRLGDAAPTEVNYSENDLSSDVGCDGMLQTGVKLGARFSNCQTRTGLFSCVPQEINESAPTRPVASNKR